MRDFFGFIWSEHRGVGLATGAALCVALVLAADLAGEAIHFANPANQNRPLEPWMSIRYVEQSWGLTKPVMFDIIGHDLQTPRDALPRSVGEVLEESGLTISELRDRIENAQATLTERRAR